jgi:DNA end-binding protein Ku
MEISKTVPFNEVDPAHLSSTYLCWPQTGSETAFDLLAEVLRGSGSAAVATVVLTKTTQQVILRWSEDLEVILVHICEFSNAIRTNDVNLVKDAASKRTVDPAMVEVAKTLLSSLEGTFDATEVEDTYGAALTEAISNATNGVTAPVTKTEKKVAAADDLLEALKASVAASTKAKVKA